jgi:hypothetical protein
MAIIFFHHSKVVRNFAKNANLPGICAEELLEKGIHYEVEVLCHDRRIPNCMKSSQPVQLLMTIEMRMDVSSSNPQDNRIFEVA